MKFHAATCPQCSGPLQLPDDREVVKCMYCGTDKGEPELTGNAKKVVEDNKSKIRRDLNKIGKELDKAEKG